MTPQPSPLPFQPPGSGAPRRGSHGRRSGFHPRPRVPGQARGPSSEDLVQELLAASVVLPEDWQNLPPATRDRLTACPGPDELLPLLVEHRLLTEYQAARVLAGTTYGLTLGNYRVLDRIGAGGMGVVFLAEHLCMRRRVAVKVLPLSPQEDARLLTRFFTEVRAIAQLQHPNIVAALDAGTVTDPDPEAPVLHFFVMEYVPGLDLEEYVRRHGPLPPARACDVIHQAAGALAEAQKHSLTHRDIKPSNILLTPEGQAKLLDFGLARHISSRMTEPGVLLGTVDYMAPEQVKDASSVDVRADIYGLGGVLYWCLTGQLPFPAGDNVVQSLACRVTQQPPSLRAALPEAPAELDAVVARMMALKPEDRYPDPQAVMQALLPFLRTGLREPHPQGEAAEAPHSLRVADEVEEGQAAARILVVDDDPTIRSFCRHVLASETVECDEAADGAQALEAVRSRPYDLVLLDLHMPEVSGPEVCRRLREDPPWPHLKVITFSGSCNADGLAETVRAGADDFLTKPVSVAQLRARVRAALELKAAQDRADRLGRLLRAARGEAEQSRQPQGGGLAESRGALVLALAKAVEARGGETAAHLRRIGRFSRRLGEELASAPEWRAQVGPDFLEMLEGCAPLHDVGKVALPDHVLLKAGKFDPDERLIMQTHTAVGADLLTQVAEQWGPERAFLGMAADVARHHHERYDGEGYPDRLAGEAIPLAARIAAVADVYDALRSRRTYRPAFSHAAALQMMRVFGGQFDPALLEVLQRCGPDLERLFREDPD